MKWRYDKLVFFYVFVTWIFLVVGCAKTKCNIQGQSISKSEVDSSLLEYSLYKSNVVPEYIMRILGEYYTDKDRKYLQLPNSYGGLASSTQYLTVYVVGDTLKGREEVKKLLNVREFKLQSALYSYKHLRIINDSLRKMDPNRNFLLEQEPFPKRTSKVVLDSKGLILQELGFQFSTLREDKNCIEICLKYCNEAAIEKFRKSILDDGCIVFKEFEEPAGVRDIMAE